MSKNLSPTAEPATPTSAALKFVQQSNRNPTNQNDVITVETSSSARKSTSEKKKRPPKVTVPSELPQPIKVSYQPFSTRLRSDLKRRLKRLSHDREDQGAEVKSVQQFIEEAVVMWLDVQEGHS